MQWSREFSREGTIPVDALIYLHFGVVKSLPSIHPLFCVGGNANFLIYNFCRQSLVRGIVTDFISAFCIETRENSLSLDPAWTIVDAFQVRICAF